MNRDKSKSNEMGEGMAKIFLVDDDRNLANLTKVALAKAGHEVVIFHEAANVMEEAKKALPDLILMDIMLPGVNGGEAVRGFMKDQTLKHIPVVFLTALISGTESDVERAGIIIDGNNYLSLGKPYEIEQLLDLVKSITMK